MNLDEVAGFDWDEANVLKNWEKHKVKYTEAEEVFVNEPKIFFSDPIHSVKETRYGLYGRTNEGLLLSIAFTVRNSKVRIVSARDMSKREGRFYYDKIKENPRI
jgi:uncharacterized DUF497 family protein